MAGFLYFKAYKSQPDLAAVRADALDYAFSANPIARECMGATPSGERGYVFGDSKRLGGRSPACDLETQVWRKIPGKDVWVGYWKDAKPGPKDLARTDAIGGFSMPMADGSRWDVPLIRSFDEMNARVASPALPCAYDLTEDGELKLGDIQDCHRWLWDLTEPAWQAMIDGEPLPQKEVLRIAGALMSVNYVISEVEAVALLRLFSPMVPPMHVVAFAVDYPTFADWADAKKKTSSQDQQDDGSSTSSGAAA